MIKGASLFQFDYESVTEFLLVKADPVTGDRWTAHLQRPDAKSTDWEILTDGEGIPIQDRKADGYFILHLLDTLRTLRVSQAEAAGPQESLGLAPPRYALQWKTASGGFEARFGLPAEKGVASYAWVPGHPAFTIEGATLQMLDYIKSFTVLRLKTWVGMASDDVDEIELIRDGKPVYYAQREGADWTDRNHKPLKGDVSSWLDFLTHQRVMNFVDDAGKAEKLRAQAAKSPLREAILKDRHGHPVRLQIARIGQQLIGLSTARPQGVFEIYREATRAFEAPRK